MKQNGGIDKGKEIATSKRKENQKGQGEGLKPKGNWRKWRLSSMKGTN